MIAFYVVEIGKVKEVYGVVIEKAVVAEAAVKAEAVKVEAKAEKQVKETKASPDFSPGGKRHSKLEKTHKSGLSKARNLCAEKKSRAQEAPFCGLSGDPGFAEESILNAVAVVIMHVFSPSSDVPKPLISAFLPGQCFFAQQ